MYSDCDDRNSTIIYIVKTIKYIVVIENNYKLVKLWQLQLLFSLSMIDLCYLKI